MKTKQTNTTASIQKIFSSISTLQVFIIGDVMLDEYWNGDTSRISPEAPVPIIEIKSKTSRLGGAANVALNCKSLGANVHLYSTIGKDENGKKLLHLLEQEKIPTNGLLINPEKITTTKCRIISKKHQVVRLDEENSDPLSQKWEHKFIDHCLRALQIEKPDILIFQDYNKGLLSKNSIEKITTHCKHLNILIAVDPKKDHFFDYKNVDIFKPNLKEIREAFSLNENVDLTLKTLNSYHQLLKEKLHHNISFITLSENGVYIKSNENEKIVAAHQRTISDVSGAGDTVIAVASIIYAITKDAILMAEIANIAGGLVCEELGVVSINKQKLLNEISK